MNTAIRESPVEEEAIVGRQPPPRRHRWRHFVRHYLEMAAIMGSGMFASAFIFMIALNFAVEGDITWEEALVDYPAHALLAVAIGMSLPMIPWMLHRGHTPRSAYEMAIVMGVPAVPFICLALLDVVKGAQCGLYCIIGFVAMLGLMLYRRAEYASNSTGS